jgi:hypothetical protein
MPGTSPSLLGERPTQEKKETNFLKPYFLQKMAFFLPF